MGGSNRACDGALRPYHTTGLAKKGENVMHVSTAVSVVTSLQYISAECVSFWAGV